MSYRKRHIRSKIHRTKPRRSVLTRLWFWILLLILAVISTLAYFVLFYSGFQLKNIVVLGNSRVKTQDIQGFVSEHAHTGLVDFENIKIISQSIFLLNNDELSKEITEKFPDIEKVVINRNLPQTVVLNVTERKPIGAFCDSQNKCFSIDANGVIFEPLTQVPTDTTIVRQVGQSGQVFTGEEVVAQNIISTIYKIQKSLKDNFRINLEEALITTPVRLDVETSENWKIYFDLSPESDINSQLTKLNLLLHGGISPDTRKKLQYIDLRPKDRAVICDNNTCGD